MGLLFKFVLVHSLAGQNVPPNGNVSKLKLDRTFCPASLCRVKKMALEGPHILRRGIIDNTLPRRGKTFYFILMVCVLSGPTETIVMGVSVSFSMNLI
jgi:hypothetical protein